MHPSVNSLRPSAVLKLFWSDEGGATAIEYGIIAGLIAVALVVSLTNVGDTIVDKFFNSIVTGLTGEPNS